MENALLESQIRHLEKRINLLGILCGFVLIALAVIIVGSHVARVNAAEDTKVLRLKGLIIEDQNGRARILLGSPLPVVGERLRKDVTGTDLVFLDEQGHDRFRVGEMLAASPDFHRIGSAYGVTILDTKGGERGGMGFLSNGSNVNRAVIALDRQGDGSVSPDAWGAIVDDATGFAGTGINYPPEGDHDQEGVLIGTQGHKVFMTFKDRNNKERSTFSLTDGTPAFQVFDENGKPSHDLLHPAAEATSEKH